MHARLGCIKRAYVLGTFPQLVITILSNINSTKAAAKQVDWAFVAILPNYNMGNGIANLYTNYDYLDLCFTQLPNISKKSLDEFCEESAKRSQPFACCKGKELIIWIDRVELSYPMCLHNSYMFL